MTNKDQLTDPEFLHLVDDIKQMIKSAQYRALQTVNTEQIALYWGIGKTIVERQRAHGWGNAIVERLSEELRQSFPDSTGFSSRNLWRMKSLYEEYSTSALILPPVVAEIGWSHNIIILEKCKDEHQRFFYIKMTARHTWSKTALTNAIAGQLWESTLLNQQNFEVTLPTEQANTAASVIRDEYTFGFLQLSEPGYQQTHRCSHLHIDRIFAQRIVAIFPYFTGTGGSVDQTFGGAKSKKIVNQTSILH